MKNAVVIIVIVLISWAVGYADGYTELPPRENHEVGIILDTVEQPYLPSSCDKAITYVVDTALSSSEQVPIFEDMVRDCYAQVDRDASQVDVVKKWVGMTHQLLVSTSDEEVATEQEIEEAFDFCFDEYQYEMSAELAEEECFLDYALFLDE